MTRQGFGFRLSNTAYLTFANLITAAGNFVFWIEETRRFSHGALSIGIQVSALVNVLSVISLFGLVELLMRQVSRGTFKFALVRRRIIFSTLGGLVISYAVYSIVTMGASHNEFELPLASSLIVLTNMAGVVTNGILAAHQKANYLLLSTLATTVVKLIVPLVVGQEFAWQLLLPLVLAFTLQPAFNILLITFLRSTSKASNLSPNDHSFAVSNWLSSVFSLLPQALIPYFVAKFLGPQHVVAIALPLTIFSGLVIPITAVGTNLFLSSARSASADETTTKKLYLSSLANASTIALLESLALFLLAPYFPLLFGSKFGPDAILFTRGLSSCLVFVALCTVSTGLLNGQGRVFSFATVNVVGSIWLLSAITVALLNESQVVWLGWLIGYMGFGFLSVVAVFHPRLLPAKQREID